MPEEDPKPICAFAVSADGLPQAIPLPKDLKEHSGSAGYTWLHFGATDVALEKWLARQLPVTIVGALI